MRPGEFWEALYAFSEEKRQDRIHLGELVRGAALRIVNTQLRKGHQIRDPRQFWQMPWDTATDMDERVRSLDALSDEERTALARDALKKMGIL